MKHAVHFTIMTLLATLGGGEAWATPIIIGTYYEENSGAYCTTGNNPYCQIMFSDVPAGKNLIVTNISCRTRINGAPIIDGYLSVPQNNSNIHRELELPNPTLMIYPHRVCLRSDVVDDDNENEIPM